MNLAMFLPVGLFGILAIRRLVPVIAGGVLLSLVTETIQATAAWVGRNCDSSDVQMNSLGALTGALLGWAILLLGKKSLAPWRDGLKVTAVVGGSLLLVTGTVWKLWITPLAVDATSLQIASSNEQRAAESALREAFGDRYRIAKVQLQPGTHGASDMLLITLDEGFAELSWPDQEQLMVSLESTSEPGPSSFPVKGSTAAPKDADGALAIATRYAKERFPWGLRGSEPTVHPVGDDAAFGWMVNWRSQADGVLMPMRLDIQVNRSGRISQLLTRKVDSPIQLPDRRVPEERAAAAAQKLYASAPQVQVGRGNLLAVRRGAEWRVQWLIPVTVAEDEVYPVYVDAESGRVDESATPEQGLAVEPEN